MMLGIFLGLSMNDSSSGISLLAGAALLVAGLVGFCLTIKSTLKF
jgi:hypothetical protein